MIHIIGGGTFSHVRNHLALAAPAFGGTARSLYQIMFKMIETDLEAAGLFEQGSKEIRTEAANQITLHLTKMAAPRQSNLVTNDDVAALVDQLITDPKTRVIVMNAALCDFDGSIVPLPGEYSTVSGPHAERLKTSLGNRKMSLSPADKIISRIRKTRKDIFLVAFKTTTRATPDEQYAAGLHLLKANSANLVLANDTVTRNNMVITPEEARYHETTDRDRAITGLAEIIMARMTNTFTRSAVVDDAGVPWSSDLIPDNLREVVNHCIAQGAYKPFRGSTVGHFAARIDDKSIVTSRRKSNFNDLADIGMVRVEYEDDTHVLAYGGKPSVGGQSQRIIFREHPDADCIVHFHCPLQETPEVINTVPQWQNECGSHQCGANTSRGLRESPLTPSVKAVMLENHGPNIVFGRDVPAEDVIAFIERNFDLSDKTGGLVS